MDCSSYTCNNSDKGVDLPLQISKESYKRVVYILYKHILYTLYIYNMDKVDHDNNSHCIVTYTLDPGLGQY